MPFCILNVVSKLKVNAIPTPEKLLNALRADNVKLVNLMFLKDSLNNWVDILSEKQNDRNNP